MEWIHYVTITVYGLFFLRIIISWLFGDFDIDADVDVGDLVSFKGLTHFLMGSFGWMSLRLYHIHQLMWYDYLIAFILGIIVMILLYFTYKLTLKLETKPEPLTNEKLVGRTATVSMIHLKQQIDGKYHYRIAVNNEIGCVEVNALSTEEYRTGDVVVIKDYINNFYLI